MGVYFVFEFDTAPQLLDLAGAQPRPGVTSDAQPCILLELVDVEVGQEVARTNTRFGDSLEA